MTIGRNIYYSWLSDLRDITFDKWAHNAGVTYESQPISGAGKTRLYDGSSMLDDFDKRDYLQAKAKKERPLAWFFLIKFPDIIEALITLPHRVCSTIHYFFYYQKERFDRIQLPVSRFGWYDVDYRLDMAAITLLLDYVDNECGGLEGEYHGLLSQSRCEEYSEDRKQQLRDLIDAYNFFKTELPALEKEIDECFKRDTEGKRNPTYKNYRELDDKREALRDKHLNSIWNNRKYLWT